MPPGRFTRGCAVYNIVIFCFKIRNLPLRSTSFSGMVKVCMRFLRLLLAL